MSANPEILSLRLTGDNGENKKVSSMNGAATKNGKLRGKVLKVKNGMMKHKLPIRICRNLRDKLVGKRSLILLDTKIIPITYR
jgi:hypothetical protein